MTPTTVSAVVATRAEAVDLVPEPLVVLENVADALGCDAASLTARPIAAGNSNFTFLVSRGEERFVLRRPPRPPYPPSTHDVLREAAILRGCAGSSVRVPTVVAAVDGPDVIGAPFYVMDFVAGEVITTELPLAFDAARDGRRIADELVDALAEIHALDWRAGGLSDLYRGDDYPGRQLRRFTGLWERYEARPLPLVREVAARLEAHRPPPVAPSLVHGDYRLGNVMYAPGSPARLVAVLDWEMAALGDPLADLGYLVATWAEPGSSTGPLLELGAVTAQPGFPSRDELRGRYEAVTGRSTEWLPWFEALACWKSAVLLEGSYQRYVRGEADDPFFARLETGVPELAAQAAAALDRL